MEKVYALVQDREITLYPLTQDQINQRNNPYEDYFEVFYNQKPVYTPLTQYLEETPVVIANYVLVNYEVKLKTIEHLLGEIFEIAGTIVNGNPFIDISQVPPDLLTATVDLVKIRTQSLLDNFAKTRDYDDIKSVCSYKDSTVEKFRLEAVRAIYLRDTTWESLNNYLNNVISGNASVPLGWNDIVSNLPTLSWDTPDTY